MSLCCTYPSHWSQSLGEELLEAGEDDFSDLWSDVLMASAITGSAGFETSNIIPVQDVEMSGGAEGLDGSVLGSDRRSDAGAALPGWREAEMPPAVPIGMVR